MLARLPSPFWAVILACMGVFLCIVVIFHPTETNIALAVLAVASNLVSGALGAFAGHRDAEASRTNVTTDNAPVTINQADPK